MREMGAHYVRATLECAETYSVDAVSKREKLARKFIRDMSAKLDDAVILEEDEMSIDSSHNGGYGWTLEEGLTFRTP